MIQAMLHNGFDVSRHHHTGIYNCKIAQSWHQSSFSPKEFICTLHDGMCSDSDAEGEQGAEYRPITFTYQGIHTTLRPWNPDSCTISAAINNHLIYFTIKPGSRIFALDCTLRTLGHLADIIGPSGRLVGVFSKNHPQRPTQQAIHRFFKRYPSVHIITEDLQNASLERYERLLGLPLSSKYAFLMARHPRLGKDSPVRKLVGPSANQLVRRIFDFLANGDAVDMSSLVVCHWCPDVGVETIRDLVLSHIDILWRLKCPLSSPGADTVGADDSGKGENDAESPDNSDQEETGPTSSMTPEGPDRHSSSTTELKRKAFKGKKSEPAPPWILLDLPTDRIATKTQNGDVNSKLSEVVASLKRLPSRIRTGLSPKEQLTLRPHFPNHTLLVLKYVTHRDQRTRKINKRTIMMPPGLEGSINEGFAESRVRHRSPTTSSMPVPSFLSSKNKRAPSTAATAVEPSVDLAYDGGFPASMMESRVASSSLPQNDQVQGPHGLGMPASVPLKSAPPGLLMRGPPPPPSLQLLAGRGWDFGGGQLSGGGLHGNGFSGNGHVGNALPGQGFSNHSLSIGGRAVDIEEVFGPQLGNRLMSDPFMSFSDFPASRGHWPQGEPQQVSVHGSAGLLGMGAGRSGTASAEPGHSRLAPRRQSGLCGGANSGYPEVSGGLNQLPVGLVGEPMQGWGPQAYMQQGMPGGRGSGKGGGNWWHEDGVPTSARPPSELRQLFGMQRGQQQRQHQGGQPRGGGQLGFTGMNF
eukprot:CAMPEP_0117589252 /NCGR_PEP_ID=MMETSP0784-20121206/70308_1 /TAXON_ID=39447 /ORGANISM="" /LENGTH=750 /DNA_ID=CAMNT_0005390711 /DNA_START=64 /DNA_END=2317 /DNA_ORIENTATION=-